MTYPEMDDSLYTDTDLADLEARRAGNSLARGICPRYQCARLVVTDTGATCPDCGWNEYGRHVSDS